MSGVCTVCMHMLDACVKHVRFEHMCHACLRRMPTLSHSARVVVGACVDISACVLSCVVIGSCVLIGTCVS